MTEQVATILSGGMVGFGLMLAFGLSGYGSNFGTHCPQCCGQKARERELKRQHDESRGRWP